MLFWRFAQKMRRNCYYTNSPCRGHNFSQLALTSDFIESHDKVRPAEVMTPNGKIYSRKRLGLPAWEQRMVAKAIKRARYMALLPYTSATL